MTFSVMIIWSYVYVCEFNTCLQECICDTYADTLFVKFYPITWFYRIKIIYLFFNWWTISLQYCDGFHNFFLKSPGNKIEPPLMVLLLKWGDPFKSNANCQSIASLKSERAQTGTIAFGEVFHMTFLLLQMLHYFQDAFATFNLFVFH